MPKYFRKLLVIYIIVIVNISRVSNHHVDWGTSNIIGDYQYYRCMTRSIYHMSLNIIILGGYGSLSILSTFTAKLTPRFVSIISRFHTNSVHANSGTMEVSSELPV
ncbi:hypothetical protein ACJX0J_024723, partial [Zea mays]